MRSRYLIIGLAVALVAVTTVLIVTARGGDSTASGGDVTVTNTVVAPGSSTSSDTSSSDTSSSSAESSSSAPPTTGTDGRPASNVPMKKLESGEKPPQFIIFSFDGAGSEIKWPLFMDAAKQVNARFTGFLSGLYLLGDSGKNAGSYTGPGHATGKASIGYGGSEESIVTEVNNLNKAYAEGHEIGTHYNGHFCAGDEPSGNQWTTADWNSELDQFFRFMSDWQTLNNYTDVPDLQVPTSEVKGGRTPCLEGDWDQLVPAWKAHDMTYDSSMPAPYSGIAWPEKKDGIWEFYMPTVYSPGFEGSVMAMDYNFWFKFNQAQDEPETAPELRQIVKGTYDFMYDQAYNGNRAPVLIANHFNVWNGDSFNPPALDFMLEKCNQPDTYCATYQDVIAWMEMQDPAVLEQILNQAPVAANAP